MLKHQQRPDATHTKQTMTTLLNRLSRLLCLVSLLALSACSEPNYKWSLYDVSGHLPDLEFSLKGVGNQTVTEASLKNKTVLVFFGYASCPDVCPTTMAQLTEVIAKLGDDAKDVRIIFISVDPHRDTPDMLQAYVNAFNKNAVGLTGSENQVAALARRYRIAYQIEKPKPGDNPDTYDVTHSRGVFIFDRFGKARLLASDTEAIDTVTADLRRLLQTTRAK
jgi:protein SCO1/2